eukprot:GAFH01003386.1.p1 GENE.GAFH01003386.1~~GAFH01003386.1.p1  ORF type:complete len:231 (-),score=49.29 GAFH01003386.1:244-936(-)
MSGKPTYHPLVGHKSHVPFQTQQYSAKDVTALTKLKTRQPGQQTPAELSQRDFRAELLEKERKVSDEKKTIDQAVSDAARALPSLPAKHEREAVPEEELKEKARPAPPQPTPQFDDADAPPEPESDGDDDDEEDEAEIYRELERIKRERAEEARRQEAEAKKAEQALRGADVERSNPLLDTSRTANVRTRWDEDVVFKNQTRGQAVEKKRFINDTVRNDFHRKFLNKYLK